MENPPALSRTDVVYICALVLVVALLTIFAFSGQPLAALALPFVIGASFGYAHARIVAFPRSPKWLQAVFVVSAALTLIWGSLSMVAPFANLVPEQRLINSVYQSPGIVLGRLALGWSVVYFGEIFRRLLFPQLYAESPREADRRSRESGRGAPIVSGLLLGLIVVAAAVFGVLDLISYLVATFMS
jgi:hypothetical protein